MDFSKKLWPNAVLCPGITQKYPKLEKQPLLYNLPPTDESFKENVRRVHLQAMVWYATRETDFLALEPTLYGSRRDELCNVLAPSGLPDSITAAPDEILNMVKCGCSTSIPCKTKWCLCALARVACSLMCSCCGEVDIK